MSSAPENVELLSCFRNGVPNLVFPVKHCKPQPVCSVSCSPSPSPCGGIERKTGGTKCIHYVSRQKQITEDSNGIRKRAVIILITKCTRSEWFTHSAHHAEIPNTLQEPEGALSPDPKNYIRWYRIISGSWPSRLLATAKINPLPAWNLLGQNQDSYSEGFLCCYLLKSGLLSKIYILSVNEKEKYPCYFSQISWIMRFWV